MESESKDITEMTADITDLVMEEIEQITALVSFKVVIIEDGQLEQEYSKDCNYKLQYDWETLVYTLISPKTTISESIIRGADEIMRMEQVK